MTACRFPWMNLQKCRDILPADRPIRNCAGKIHAAAHPHSGEAIAAGRVRHPATLRR
jgi:hypothetical protein